jgi:two-component system, NtrC family, response regulator AtoC
MIAPEQATQRTSVLLVDDDDLFVDAAADILRSRGYQVQTAHSLRDAEACLRGPFDWLVVDYQLPDGSGLSLVPKVDRERTRVVLVSANPRLETAIEALRLGVCDYLPKPLDFDFLVDTFRPDRRQPPAPASEELLPSLRQRATLLTALARSRCPLLVTGETGTGKGHLARTIHDLGGASLPFVTINCAAIPAALMEAELFGVERGAFTGAERRPGLLEIAHGGTLLLDELGELPPALQAKLLTFLDDGMVRRVGATQSKRAVVRIIAATSKDLEAARLAGELRADLLHRLDVARIELPPLRQRLDDLQPLTSLFLARLAARDGRRYALAEGEMARLMRYDWPGNAREVHNTLERSTLVCPPGALAPSSCLRTVTTPAVTTAGRAPAGVVREGDLSLERVEREHIVHVLQLCNGNRGRAASVLGIGVSTLRRKLVSWNE